MSSASRGVDAVLGGCWVVVAGGSSLVPHLRQNLLDNGGEMSDREHEMDDMDDIMDEGAEFDIPQNAELNDDLMPEINNESEKKKVVGKKKRAPCWKHFTLLTQEGHPKPRAACNCCGIDYACHSKLNGTKSLTHHLAYQCTKFPPSKKFTGSRQKLLSFQRKENNGETSANLVPVAFSADACKRALARMIIIDELPFSFVDGEGFRDFISVVQPMWNPPRRLAMAKQIMVMYEEEKKTLKHTLKHQRVCLTTGTWTSVQNLNYMCLTGHFIDENWRMAEFWSCVKKGKIVCRLKPCLDVSTRWNYTYFMLERALTYQKAFDRLCDDPSFKLNVREEEMDEDFDDVDSFEGINRLFLILDAKLHFFEYCLQNTLGYDKAIVGEFMDRLKSEITRLFGWYEKHNGSVNVHNKEVGGSSDTVDLDGFETDFGNHKSLKSQFKMHKQKEGNMASKMELEKYLAETSEDDCDNFDVLRWWKLNSSKYPIGSQMARDVLAIPVSTVASESAFSTGGRVIDPY
ncbi:hypothetical protein RHSIM_Rhsim02G0143700 [Rhododendron simsii]|uniref:BED-type domain-containing protein n=1 Tax=Rhododendron simsii TaxID=118357 RepID=A0A834HF80_RHOSS|nr:hypothetical protein RHSIM_Rhsim02G0143700 [Rhododendron simsii]